MSIRIIDHPTICSSAVSKQKYAATLSVGWSCCCDFASLGDGKTLPKTREFEHSVRQSSRPTEQSFKDEMPFLMMPSAHHQSFVEVRGRLMEAAVLVVGLSSSFDQYSIAKPRLLAYLC